MTPFECLAAFGECGLLPADSVEETIRVAALVDAKVLMGEMTEDEAEKILDDHAARVVESRRETEGEFSPEEKELVGWLAKALGAHGAPS